MKWDAEQLLNDFLTVADLAGIMLPRDAIRIETLPMPHRPPSKLPTGRMAVYVFSDKDRVLKVGQVGWNSKARYTSQHYNAASSNSNLAKSLLKDEDAVQRYGVNDENVSDWIKANTDRVNFILDVDLGKPTLNLLEAFVQCRLKPAFEGFASQR